jgi:hypothetical protein
MLEVACSRCEHHSRRLNEKCAERRQTADWLAAAQKRIAALLTDQRAKSDSLSDLETPARPRWSWWWQPRRHRKAGFPENEPIWPTLTMPGNSRPPRSWPQAKESRMIQRLVLAFVLLVAPLASAAAQQPQQPGNTQFDCTAFKSEGGSVYLVTKPTVVVWAGRSFELQPGQTFNLDELKVDPQLLKTIQEHCKK